MVCQADRVAERVDFPFAFVKFRFHVRQVAHPFASFGVHVESVGVWVDIDTFKLAVDDSCQHLFQFGVFIGKLHIRPYLRTGIAEPHGVDVSGVYKSVLFSVEVNGSVQCVREAVLEHPCQFRIGQ